MLKWLLEERGKEYLEREYTKELRSAANIATELGVFPVEIIRALHHHKLHVRNKSEARLASLRIGHSIPSMLGRKHPEAVKQKIARTLKERKKTNGEVQEGNS